MKTDVKKLRLGDVIYRRRGGFALRLIHFVFGAAIGLFFRRIEVVNSEKLPARSGLIFVSNHPNALIDPALLFIALPRQLAFLAKSTLFDIPVFSALIKTVGALPLYRQKDAGADISKNQETFAAAHTVLKAGGAIAIFPEGVSHNEPQLQPLKTGAARIALGAASVEADAGALDLQIVPVGLFYTSKTTFRSEALLYFGEAFRVSPVGLDEHGHPPKESVRELTAKIETALREVTLNAESESKIAVARIAEEVFTSLTPKEENLAERLEFLQRFVIEAPFETDEKLEKKLAEYDKKLARLGIESEFLALADFSKRFVIKQAFLRSWYLILLAPLAAAGAILHFPAYQISKFLAFLQTKKGDFDMASTVKMLSGVVLMPLTWTIFAATLYFYFEDWRVAALSIPLAVLCGYVALRTLEEIEDLSGWLKAISAFFLKREKFLRLLAERRRLFEKVQKSEKVKE